MKSNEEFVNKVDETPYRIVMESMSELICRFLPDTTLTFVNKAYCNYLGKTAEELIGTKFLTLMSQKDGEFMMNKIESLRIDNPIITYEHYVLTAKGEILWYRWTDKAFFDRNGKVVEIQSVGIDITNLKDSEELLRKNYNAIEKEVRNRTKELKDVNIKLKREIEERKIMEKKLKENLGLLRQSLNSSIDVILKMMKIRDPYTVQHQERVAYLAYRIAKELSLSKSQRNCIYIAGLLHDVGKIYIPFDFLGKPTKLTKEEFNIIKSHSEIGYKILKKVKFPWPIDKIILQHHEKIDGSGYPYGLQDKDILLESKIITVADVVEAMSSHRPYRPALGTDLALEEIEKNKGIYYDEDVVEACLKVFLGKDFYFENFKYDIAKFIE
ncbi:HD domain-containing protein [Clostridiaceae bacterium 35-E11]